MFNQQLKNISVFFLLFCFLFLSPHFLFSKDYTPQELLKSEIKLAALLKEENHNQKAISHYKKLVKKNHSISIYMDMGILYKRLGELSKAKKILQEAIEKKPKNKEVMHALSDIYFEDEDYKNAQKYLKKIKENKETVTKLALIANRMNQPKSAIHYYQLLVQKYKQSFQRINLAILYEKQNNLDKAEAELLALYEESTDKYYATRYLLRFYKKHQQTEKLTAFVKQLKLKKKKKRKMRPLLKSRR